MKSIIVFFMLCLPVLGLAHFQVLLPSADMVTQGENSHISLSYLFTHPFEQGPVMEMKKPVAAGVLIRGKKESLLSTLIVDKIDGQTAWKSSYQIKRPGDHIFYTIPDLYFEPAESVYIQHMTKVVVNAYGMEDAWDKPIGIKAEIVPLTRPYALWTGQLFSGQVLYKGKSVPFAEIEMEYFNENHRIKAPNDGFITQVIKSDQNGVFHAVLPLSGWWAFAALIEDDYRVTRDGKSYPVELGAVFWVKATKIE